jgi:hypothetical protein
MRSFATGWPRRSKTDADCHWACLAVLAIRVCNIRYIKPMFFRALAFGRIFFVRGLRAQLAYGSAPVRAFNEYVKRTLQQRSKWRMSV